MAKKLDLYKGKTAVFHNGKLLGYVDDGEKYFQSLIKARREGNISKSVNFYYSKKTSEIFVNSDQGRARRPYIVVENGKSKLTPDLIEKLKQKQISWGKLVSMGVIEYLDADEEEHALIATT
ncbi:MAG: hypothetical protein QXV44_00835, partial [Candidatus Anstonellaceae archaeon]